MNYIKSLHIEGFKKFAVLDVQFNEHMNITSGIVFEVPQYVKDAIAWINR